MIFVRQVCSLRKNLYQLAVQNESRRHLTLGTLPLCAGHSKWANIKHIKAEKDGQKAVLFTRIARQLRLAMQEGGSADPNLNSQLKSVIEDAVRRNMPMASIQNNIKKFKQSKDELKKYVLELRYKQKVFAVCVLYTDKFTTLKMELAPILRKAGAVYADSIHMFDDFGLIEATIPKVDEELILLNLEERATEDAIECGAEDIEVVDKEKGLVNFICKPLDLNMVQKHLKEKGYLIENADHIYSAKNEINLTADELKAYETFVNKLKDVPGVEDIYDNIAIAN